STRKTWQSDNGSGPGDSGFWRAFNTSRMGVLLQRPPSQYEVPPSSVAGKHGGKLQLASTWRGGIAVSKLSNVVTWSVLRSTAVRISRGFVWPGPSVLKNLLNVS